MCHSCIISLTFTAFLQRIYVGAFLPVFWYQNKRKIGTKAYTITSDIQMESSFQISSFYNTKCGRITLYRRTDR